MPTYTNIELMLRDIEGYLRATGEELLVADDPMRGMLGFTVTEEGGPRWEVSLLTVIGRYIAPELQSRFVGNAESRVLLAQELMHSARVGGRVGVADEETVRGLVDAWHRRVDRGNLERHGVPVTPGPRGVEERGTQQAGGSEGGTPWEGVPTGDLPLTAERRRAIEAHDRRIAMSQPRGDAGPYATMPGRRSGGSWESAVQALSAAAENIEALDRRVDSWGAAPLVAQSRERCFCARCGEHIQVGESYRDGGTVLGRAHVRCVETAIAGPNPGAARTLFDQLMAGDLKIDETR